MARSSRPLGRKPGTATEAGTIAMVREGNRCAISHPCFELWLLLHFRTHTSWVNNEAVRNLIRQCPCGYSDKAFDFAKVWPYHQTAMRNAAELDARQRSDRTELADRNPWTSVHELVGQLLTLAAGRGAGR
jgi:hypothetical protein